MIPVTIELANAQPSKIELAYWFSQIALFFIAGGSLVAAAVALWQNAKSRKGTLLLELDARFDSPDMKDARATIAALTEQTNRLVSEKNLTVADGAKHVLIRQEWVGQVRALREQGEKAYSHLMSYAGFFETVGLMVKRGYIAADDVIKLFKGPILDMDMALREHIGERSKEIGVPEGLLEHALYLADLAKKSP